MSPTRAPDKVNLREKLALFTAHGEPKIVGGLNGSHLKPGIRDVRGRRGWPRISP